MEPRKDGSNQHLEERLTTSSDYEQVNDEEKLDTSQVSHSVEEGDEDYDDEELDSEELTEDDFEIDDEDEEDDEIL